jgi:hypothetical protein
MVKRIASAGVVGLMLMAAGVAVCQDGRESLPDAPSAVVAAQRLNARSEETVSPANSEAGFAAGPMRQEETLVFDGAAGRGKDPEAFFRKYLSSSPVKQQPVSANSSVMGRATHAMARTVVTRNESGKGRLNTSYLLRTLGAVAKDSASTPYWRRHLTDAAGDFGSTVGSDVGMNLWHEFGPSLEHLASRHTPVFISRIEQHLGAK